ncbi:adenine phosphoribosyltransferase [Leptolyngbyaceae cyanobacterium JSC-12]|nr:adenine phosphoribosyltransferase [Leptolyngbyaceae cyanobacterium JSC-12]
MDIKTLIREVPDFPKPGISFKDITTLLRDAKGFEYTIHCLAEKCADLSPDFIAGMESRGFIFGAALATKLEAGFVPVRKPGKLPAAVHAIEYELEYGRDRLEVHQDALYPPGSKVLMVDDLIATGGTAGATATLIQQAGGTLVGCAFVIELVDLKGREKLPSVPIISLVQYEGD